MTTVPTPPSASPDPAPAYTGGKPTNRQVLDALEYSPIAGGKGTPPDLRVTKDDADYVVHTRDELVRRASEAGKTVFIPGEVSIDLTTTTLDVRATVASDRGVGDSEGALLYSNAKGRDSHAWNGGGANGNLQLRGNGRLTGLRYRGFAYNYHNNPEHPGYIPFAPGATVEERAIWRLSRTARGINIRSSNVQIDNCEIFGWSYSALHIGSTSTSYSPVIRNSHFHDNMLTSAGYACEVFKGWPTFRDCYFNAHRHAIAGFGFADGGFVIENCVFGPSASSFQIDMHGLHNNFSAAKTVDDPNSEWYHGQAGGRMAVRNCTHLYTHVISDANYDQGRPCAAVSIRGIPSPRHGNGIVLENNAYAHRSQGNNTGGSRRAIPCEYPHHQQTRRAGDQGFEYPVESDGFTANFHQRGNAHGILSTAPPADRGASIDLRNPPTEDDLPTGGGTTPKPVTDPWDQDPDPNRRAAIAKSGRRLVDEFSEIADALDPDRDRGRDTNR